ncbi:hypothetical protein Rhe02_09200 [Rhizocola hellebori]|uniref:Uncharacterized protein n=1 Tax=Rhizocola hellebori TaxID=1392758 RepID=A0A8J3Q2S9_9ACTN|nr:hypothetical protein Rhe02_09200 [Rhizocola hellebori]
MFLLVSNIYPAILGTMIWELISQIPTDPIAWIATLLIVSHFTLDLLYLKLNLDFYNAEDDFRYGWLLFLVDVAIVALIRLAFGTIPALADSRHAIVNPITCFAVIYVLYVTWEYLYRAMNRAEKRSPDSSTTHYWYLAAWFAICTATYSASILANLPAWIHTATVIGFLLGIAAACAELYWSVFLAVNDRKATQDKRADAAPERTAIIPTPQEEGAAP